MKSILLASALFSVATLASAQRVEAGQGQPMSGADTLITLTEGELAEAVQRVAAARLAAERSTVTLQSQQQTTHLNSGISAEMLRIIKLQMLFQALGLTPGQAPQIGAQTSVQHSYLPYPLPQQAQAPLRDPRVDRLEQLMMLLVQQRQAERNAIVLPGKTGRSTTPASRNHLQPQQVVAQNTSSTCTAATADPAASGDHPADPSGSASAASTRGAYGYGPTLDRLQAPSLLRCRTEQAPPRGTPNAQRSLSLSQRRPFPSALLDWLCFTRRQRSAECTPFTGPQPGCPRLPEVLRYLR